MSRHVTDRDLGWNKIKQELEVASRLEVAVGLFYGDKNSDGTQVVEYGTYNEFGTDTIPSRPFMRTAFDENRGDIQADIDRQSARITSGQVSAHAALTIIGQKHARRIQNTITGRDFLPRLSPETVRRKKGSEKTLVDSSVMVNAVKISVRSKT